MTVAGWPDAESVEAYRLKLAFADFYDQPAEMAEIYLAEWVEMTILSGLDPMADFACSVAEHWYRVVRWLNSKVSKGILEARGNRSQDTPAAAALGRLPGSMLASR